MFPGSLAISAKSLAFHRTFADELLKTPRQTEGPFCPNWLPLESVSGDFAPVKDSKIGELAAKLHIILGEMPETP